MQLRFALKQYVSMEAIIDKKLESGFVMLVTLEGVKREVDVVDKGFIDAVTFITRSWD